MACIIKTTDDLSIVYYRIIYGDNEAMIQVHPCGRIVKDGDRAALEYFGMVETMLADNVNPPFRAIHV